MVAFSWLPGDTRLGYTRPRKRIRKPAENLAFREIGGESLRLRRRVASSCPGGGRTLLPQRIWQAGDGFGHSSQLVNSIPAAFAVRSVAGNRVVDLLFHMRIILEVGLRVVAPGVHRGLAAIGNAQVSDKLAVDL